MNSRQRWTYLLGLVTICGSAPAFSQGASYCGDLKNHFGPFDYRNASRESVDIVEKHHFTPQVEQLLRGQSGYLGGDLSYTLGVFPNHVRALMSMANLGKREKTSKPSYSRFTVDCWFDRAMRFAPDDPSVRVAYGVVLLRDGKKKQALEQLEKAASFGGASPNVYYNLGLVYFDLGEYDKSLAAAREAYRLGFDLPGLKNKLVKTGKWKEPAGAESAPTKVEKSPSAEPKTKVKSTKLQSSPTSQ